MGEQPGRMMGVTATPKYKKGADWMHKEREEYGDFDQKYCDHHVL